jgi:hypothetical protein
MLQPLRYQLQHPGDFSSLEAYFNQNNRESLANSRTISSQSEILSSLTVRSLFSSKSKTPSSLESDLKGTMGRGFDLGTMGRGFDLKSTQKSEGGKDLESIQREWGVTSRVLWKGK